MLPNQNDLTSVALDFGGSHIKIALMGAKHILSAKVLPNMGSLDDLSKIAHIVKEFLSEYRVIGLGVSFAAIVNPEEGTILSTNGKYQWAINFNFKKWAAAQFPELPFAIENDARLALLGETTQGVAAGCQNAVLFMLGTGIGTSAIIEGRLLRGVHYQGGILSGHLGSDIHGLPCNCGGIGCLEAQVGGWQLAQILSKVQQQSNLKISADLKQKYPHYKALFDSYKQGDSFAEKVLLYLLPLWARGVANLILAYDPEVVVCTGGVFHAAQYMLPYLQEYVEKHVWTHWGTPQLVVAKDVSSSTLLGCDTLVRNPKS